MDQSARTRRLNDRHRKEREKSNHDLPLFKLPPELRNRIFGFVLPSDETFTIKAKEQIMFLDGKRLQYDSVRAAPDFQRVFGVTQVCRQIRAETLRVVYASNTFTLPIQGYSPKKDAHRWVSSRPSEALSAMFRVALHSGSEYRALKDWCARLHVVFDFKQKATQMLLYGCDDCERPQKAKSEDYRRLLHRNQSLEMSPREKLVALIDEFQVIFEQGLPR